MPFFEVTSKSLRGSRTWIRRFLRDERGNVESSLVLIPLIFLFLATLQIVIALNFRNLGEVFVQSEATSQAIAGEVDVDAEISTLDRFGNLRLLTIERLQEIPTLIPGLAELLGREPSIKVRGTAVIEEIR